MLKQRHQHLSVRYKLWRIPFQIFLSSWMEHWKYLNAYFDKPYQFKQLNSYSLHLSFYPIPVFQFVICIGTGFIVFDIRIHSSFKSLILAAGKTWKYLVSHFHTQRVNNHWPNKMVTIFPLYYIIIYNLYMSHDIIL